MILRHVISLALLTCVVSISAHAQNVIARDVIAAGGSDMSNGTYRVTGTAGQAIIGGSSAAAWVAGQGFWYRIASTPADVGEIPRVPMTPELHQNYPNPFNPTTTIVFTLPSRMHVRIELFQPNGQLLDVLVDETRHEGRHFIFFEAATLPAGAYICRLTSGTFCDERKMLLLK